MYETVDSETLAMLADSAARFRAESYALEQRREWLSASPGYSVDAWREYATLGWLGVPLPSEWGGFGGEPRSIGVLMEYAGAALALEPLLASSVLCGRLLSRSSAHIARETLAAIASGERIFALAHAESLTDGVFGSVRTSWNDGRASGEKTLVLHGDVADRLLVSARDRSGRLVLALVDPSASGVSLTPMRLVDGRGAATLVLVDAPAELLEFDDAETALEAALDEARLAMCSEALGAVRELNEATNAYLKTRQQFGKPIGTNQALQHRMVELYMLEQELRAVIDAAQRSLAGPAPARARAVSGAAAHAAAAARHCAHEAVQMHGGMGMTVELPVSHYFKRLMVTARLLGDREHHLERFAAANARVELAA